MGFAAVLFESLGDGRDAAAWGNVLLALSALGTAWA